MNKRIRGKVAKRIINKIGTEQILTNFERKYFVKFFWKPLRKEVTRIVEELEIEELSVAEETAVEQAEWLSGIDLAEGPGMTVQSIVEIQKESKWQKAKIKVKGWFGK